MTPMAAGFPWERIAMDIVGPQPNTLRNNRYLLVVIDYYTRWPETFALENQDAHSVAIRLISDIISRYGAPYIIHSDQGTNFESKLIAELCKLYEIKKTRHYDVPPTIGQTGGTSESDANRHDRTDRTRRARELGHSVGTGANGDSIGSAVPYGLLSALSTVWPRDATTRRLVLRSPT